MFQLSKIKNLLVGRATHFSIDLEENFKNCKSSDELNVLERKVADADMHEYKYFFLYSIYLICYYNLFKLSLTVFMFITFFFKVKQISSIGGRKPAHTVKNILLTLEISKNLNFKCKV